MILAGIVLTVVQLVVSIRNRAALADRTGDPWNGRTLEWSIASPPPPWNFAVLPQVQGTDAYWAMKQAGRATAQPAAPPRYEPIHVPRNHADRRDPGLLRRDPGLRADLAHLVAGDRRPDRPGGEQALSHAWSIEREIAIPADEIAAFEQARARSDQGRRP